ncbi:TonB-dependent siderophore receptor [Flavihumibacter cheonanensis]|uniref:TonB-dependent receptor n=1 Tax=Flavihumibacter cheonanensis TaxID=1442385 RepID=UPI001EF94152|nr:TonB-dependent receptor [Flavihumibacter cheonanensis]MCG7750930.1 TonB-dependent receptor [Flavihumibacter cheonanensis]
MRQIVLVIVLTFSVLGSIAQNGTAILKGKITTADKKPGEGVTVVLQPINRTVLADNGGNYNFSGLEAGEYTLLVSLVSYEDITRTIELAAGETKTEDIQLNLSNRELNEVVVIGNKNSFKTNRVSNSLRLGSSLLETPQNIQVVTSKLINDQQIFDMLEGVTRNVSGASRVEHWDNYARITMRGSNVGAFRNGMNVSTTWGPLTEDISMVERIEFVKGPAGFMLSNGDPAGFYNVVTKKPSGRNKGEVTMSLGSFDLYRATADIDGKLTENGKLLYRINVMGQLKGSHRQFDFNNRYSIVPVLKYLIDDRTSVTLEYTHQFSEVNLIGSNYLFSKRGYADQPRTMTLAESRMPATRMLDRSLLAIFDHKLNENWKLTAQAAYFNYNQEGASLWAAGFDPNNDSLLQRSMSSWDVLGTSKMGQLFLNGEEQTGAISHKFLVGLDMSNKEYFHDWNQYAMLGLPTFNVYKPVYGQGAILQVDRSKDIRERGVRYYNGYTGFYVQDEMGFLEDKLRLTLAGRITQLKTGDVYSGDFKRSKFTPRVGLSYSIDANTAAYALVDQSFMENYGVDETGRVFDPVTGTNMELGIKRDWMNGKWNSAVTVYQIKRDNVLAADPNKPNPAGGFFNTETRQETKGVEVDIKGQLLKGLDVIINYAFTEAKVVDHPNKAAIGTQVAGSSRHIQNAWLNYRLDRGKLAGFGVSLGYQYQAKRSPWFVFDGTENSLPDYFRMDGSLSYQRKNIGFNLVVNNILNKYLYSGAPYANFFYWQAEPGTNVRFSVGYKF